MPDRATGTYEITTVAGKHVHAFLPAPLPPREPDLDLSGQLLDVLTTADRAVARLDVATGPRCTNCEVQLVSRLGS
jgi:hypothetical protein